MKWLYASLLALPTLSCVSPQEPCPAAPAQSATKPGVASSDAAALLPESDSPVTFAKMAEFPEPGWQVPRAAAFAPDGKRVTYLMSEADTDEMALHVLDVAAGTSKVLLRAKDLASADQPSSVTSELRNERQRKRIKGITEYQWAKAADVLIVPAGGDVFVVKDGAVQDLTTAEGEVVDPKICADGTRVAFVRGSELAFVDVATRKETALTSKAPAGVTRGLSDFNGQEEFDEPSGHFFAPDCKTIAYLEVDERGVGEAPVMGHRAGAPSLMMQKYPRTGEANPKVSIFVSDVTTRASARVPLPAAVKPDAYFGRFRFTPDSKSLVFLALDRSQRKLDLVVTKLGPKPVSHVASSREVTSGWLEMADVAIDGQGANAFTIAERDGHDHLARVALDGAGAAPVFLTQGPWDVIGIEGRNAKTNAIFVTATKDHIIGRRLFEVSPGGEIKLVTPDKGTHDIAMASSGEGYIDVFSSLSTPPRVTVHAGDTKASIELKKDPDIDAMKLRSAEVFEVAIAGGETLYGAMLAPRQIDPTKRYPLVVMVYGGPGVQTVMDRWSPRLMWQHLADRGFYVMQVDNRGSSGRGPAFARPIDRKLGVVELEDQLAALGHVLAKHPIDARRVGIYGHSYGGFLSALAMLKTPDRFRAGVAGSPVTDWRTYDTGYTERYMGTPKDNPAGYDAVDLEKLAGNLQGELLIVHALMDENVHFQNSADLVDALVKEKKTFEMFVFPGERHGYRSPAARTHAMATVTRFLTRTLGPEQ